MNYKASKPIVFDKKLQNEALKYFKDILKMDSRNPDSNEEKVVRYLDQILKKEGLKTQIVFNKKGRLNLICRLAAQKPTESGLMLTSHVDTVPWNEKEWSEPPLSANEKDGYIYGRGAIDMKHHTIYSLMALLKLKRDKTNLKRDVLFVAFADEEAGCTEGSQFVVEKHPNLLSGVGYALNEVGGFPVYIENKQFYFVQTEEKGFAWYEIKLPGKEGHGSLASKQNANYAMSDLIQKIRDQKILANPSDLTKQLIDAMSEDFPFFKKFIFRLLKNSYLNQYILQILPEEKRESFYAMTHSTLAPTMIKSSDKVNVVPGEAIVYVDGRFLPNSTLEEITMQLQKVLPKKATMKLIKHGGPVLDIGKPPLYSTIEKELLSDIPKTKVIPYTLIGFSDASQLQKLNIKTVGFSPVFFPPDVNFSDLFHGHNERIHKEGFLWGCDIFYRVVKNFSSQN